MRFVEKWPSRCKGNDFLEVRLGGHKFSVGSIKIPISLWGNCPCMYLPPLKGLKGERILSIVGSHFSDDYVVQDK